MKQKSVLMSIAVSMVLLGCFPAWVLADEPVRIMPLGDSITKGVGSECNNGYRKPLYLNLINSGYNVNFVGSQSDGNFADADHEGYDGWHAEGGIGGGLLPNVYNWLVANPADIVLLHIGTNDITRGDEDVNEVSDILDEIDRFSEDITVILALIINRQSYSSMTTQFNNDLYDMALNRIANGDDIIIVDMESALNYSTDMTDRLHPNDAGYAKMADVWYDALDNLLAIAPTVTSTPVTDATAGQLYTYDVDANGCPLPSYILTIYPDGMTIDPNTGLIEWLSTDAGDFDVTVEVSNGQVPDANQSFAITMSTIIEFDAASSYSSNSDDTTLSWPHTVGSGDSRILVVGIIGKDDSVDDLVISSIKYNDINMDLVEGSSQSVYSSTMYVKTELYYLLDEDLPSPGTYNIVVTYNGNVSERNGGAISLANVEQQATEAVVTNSDTDTNTISTNITTHTNGAWVVDVVGCDNSGTFTTTAEDMVWRWHETPSGASGAGSTRLVESAEETTMSWTNPGANQLAHSVAAFAPIEITPIISGYIREPNNAPVDGALVSADPNGSSYTADPNGRYEVLVPYGWSGTVTAAKTEYIFDPSERTYSNVITDRWGQDYKNITTYDLDWDGFIGWGDIEVISEHWLEVGQDIEGDINNDETVNFPDFAEFALAW